MEIPAFLCLYLKTARMAEIPTNIDRTSNRCNLGSRWAIEDPNKTKIIRIWRWRWWAHQNGSSCEGMVTRGLYSYLKNRQKMPNEAEKRVFHRTPKFVWTSREKIFMIYKIQISKINCKIKSILSGSVTRKLYFLKKKDTKQAFSPSCRNWPIWVLSHRYNITIVFLVSIFFFCSAIPKILTTLGSIWFRVATGHLKIFLQTDPYLK